MPNHQRTEIKPKRKTSKMAGHTGEQDRNHIRNLQRAKIVNNKTETLASNRAKARNNPKNPRISTPVMRDLMRAIEIEDNGMIKISVAIRNCSFGTQISKDLAVFSYENTCIAGRNKNGDGEGHYDSSGRVTCFHNSKEEQLTTIHLHCEDHATGNGTIT
ncbi:hypothetical protein BHE74_00028005 [Ensete ventricosum]|nr:hypothetical protein BHE74_00028005 [Ensete ventricosum]